MKTTVFTVALLAMSFVSCQKDETKDLGTQNASPVLVTELNIMTGNFRVTQYSKLDEDLSKQMSRVKIALNKGNLMTGIIDDQTHKGTYLHDRRASKISFKIAGSTQMDVFSSATWVIYPGETGIYKLVSEDGTQMLIINRIVPTTVPEDTNPA